MRTKVLLAGVASALLFVLPACSTVEPDAATVNGDRIDRRDFEDLLEVYRSNEAFTSAQRVNGNIVEGDGAQSVSGSFARGVLSEMIFNLLVSQEAEARDVVVSDAARTEAELLLRGSYGDQAWEAFPEDFRADRVQETAELMALGLTLAGEEDVSAEELQARYDLDPDAFALRCMSHILLGSEADAEAVKGELDAGANFGDTAVARSTDPSAAQNRGELGCYGSDEAQLDQDFLAAAFDAEVGEVTEPVETSFGWHLILVTEEQPQSYEEAAERVKRGVFSSLGGPLSEVLQPAQGAAEVSVDPRYGVWDEQGFFVREGPTTGVAAP